MSATGCVKCGSKQISTAWHRGRRYFSDLPYCGYGDTQKDGEHLHHYCQGCHYDWTTPTLDAGPRKAKVAA